MMLWRIVFIHCGDGSSIVLSSFIELHKLTNLHIFQKSVSPICFQRLGDGSTIHLDFQDSAVYFVSAPLPFCPIANTGVAWCLPVWLCALVWAPSFIRLTRFWECIWMRQPLTFPWWNLLRIAISFLSHPCGHIVSRSVAVIWGIVSFTFVESSKCWVWQSNKFDRLQFRSCLYRTKPEDLRRFWIFETLGVSCRLYCSCLHVCHIYIYIYSIHTLAISQTGFGHRSNKTQSGRAETYHWDLQETKLWNICFVFAASVQMNKPISASAFWRLHVLQWAWKRRNRWAKPSSRFKVVTECGEQAPSSTVQNASQKTFFFCKTFFTLHTFFSTLVLIARSTSVSNVDLGNRTSKMHVVHSFYS